ncbi:Guanylate kinase [Gammaproteobacteria bacterium]
MNDLFIISAASGTGKTSLVKALQQSLPNLAVSISHTTRAPRPGETNDIHYHFVDKNHFEALLEQQAFIEYAHVFNNFYGTTREELIKNFSAGKDVILEIDWQGARQVRITFPEAIGIFILPPSREILRQRLQGRGQDRAEIIENRLAGARSEISHWNEFEYTVINNDFSMALAELEAIVRARRLLRTHRAIQIAALIDSLLD